MSLRYRSYRILTVLASCYSKLCFVLALFVLFCIVRMCVLLVPFVHLKVVRAELIFVCDVNMLFAISYFYS